MLILSRSNSKILLRLLWKITKKGKRSGTSYCGQFPKNQSERKKVGWSLLLQTSIIEKRALEKQSQPAFIFSQIVKFFQFQNASLFLLSLKIGIIFSCKNFGFGV